MTPSQSEELSRARSWFALITLCLTPFGAFIRLLNLPFLLGVRQIHLAPPLHIFACSIVPIAIIAIKRLSYSGYMPGVILDLASWFLCVLFLTGTRVDSRVADTILYFLVGTFFLNYPLLYLFDTPMLWYVLHGGDANDLFKGLFFRNPGIFNEPSTYCYIILIVFLFSARTGLQACFVTLTCFMSTSLGGILTLVCVFTFLLRLRHQLLVGAICFVGVLTFLSFFEDGGYFGERIVKILDGSDGSAGGRLATLSHVKLTLFGMDAVAIADLYELSTVKSIGFISNVFVNLGMIGVFWLVVLIVAVPKSDISARLVLLAFMKFDVFSAPAWVLLLCKRVYAKQ